MKIYNPQPHEIIQFIDEDLWVKICHIERNYGFVKKQYVLPLRLSANGDMVICKTQNSVREVAYPLSDISIVPYSEIYTTDEYEELYGPMRVYSSRQRYTNKLDRYIGKDIWVLVQYKGYLYWIRPIRTEGYYDSSIVANSASFAYFDEDSMGYTEYTGGELVKDSLMNDIKIFIRSDIEVVEPLELRSTRELFHEEY